MASHPHVSVVLPVYNARRYLASAVQSVLAQTYQDFELIAVDDGSTDDSLSILRRFERADVRVRVLSRPNTGIVGALNDGVAAGTAPLIARMDADDLSLPERLERQVAFMDAHLDHVLVGAQVLLIDPDGNPICLKHDTGYTHEEIDAAHLGDGWPVVHPAVVVRREAMQAVGGYREAYRWIEDMDLFLRLAEVGKLANLPDVVLQYRLHFDSVCHTRSQEQALLKQKLLDETHQRRGLQRAAGAPRKYRPRSAFEQHSLWAWWALRAGNVSTARRHALKSLTSAPFSPDSWRIVACAVRGH